MRPEDSEEKGELKHSLGTSPIMSTRGDASTFLR